MLIKTSNKAASIFLKLAFYSETFINENCGEKKKHKTRLERHEQSKREGAKEEIKNQQTTNNIILTSRAISRHTNRLRGEMSGAEGMLFRTKQNTELSSRPGPRGQRSHKPNNI